MSSQIHPTAIIEPGAEIGDDCSIGPYCIIGPHVKIGDKCKLKSHIVIEGHTTIGKENEFAGVGYCTTASLLTVQYQCLAYSAEGPSVRRSSNLGSE